MRSVKQIREIFGMSQEQLAAYLSVTRSLLALSEQGRRSLPAKALYKLAKLELSLQSNTPYKTESLQTQVARDAAHIKAHAKKCLQQAALQKTKLQLLLQEYQQCMQALTAIGHLRQNQPAKKELLLLELLESKVLKKMNKCGYAAQVVLQLRIGALQHEAAQADKIKF